MVGGSGLQPRRGLHLCTLPVRAQTKVCHYRISTAADGSLYLQRDRLFPSLDELLAYYKANWKLIQSPLLQPCTLQVGLSLPLPCMPQVGPSPTALPTPGGPIPPALPAPVGPIPTPSTRLPLTRPVTLLSTCPAGSAQPWVKLL